MSSSYTFRPHARYLLISGIALFSVAALVWLSLRRLELAELLFLLFALGLLFYAVRSLFSRVEVDEHGLTLVRPGLRSRCRCSFASLRR